MSGAAESALLAVQTVQLLLASFDSALNFGAFFCPLDAPIDTVTSTRFDYIIVGGGSAGSVLANRLSACGDVNVLLLEAGGCPPVESFMVGLFPVQPLSAFDFNMTAENDGYSGQSLQGGAVGTTAGRMLGGSSALHHDIHVRGCRAEYDRWAAAAADSSWSYDGLLPYFKRSTNVVDEDILAECGDYCGTDGPVKLTRQSTSNNDPIIAAYKELAYDAVNNSNADVTSNIIVEPQLELGDNIRQSGLYSYIYPAKDRSNLYILSGATVSRINLAGSRPTERATGVTFTYQGTEYTVEAAGEVIVAAGALKTPQLLMLSGIGPADHLREMGIPVALDLPVGDNLQDHVSASMIISLAEDNSPTAASNPYAFPVPVTCSYINLSDRADQCAEFQSINLVFPNDNAGFLQLCTNVFKYTDEICDAMYAGNTGKQALWMVPNLLHPVSTGTVRLTSTDVEDQPKIELGLLSDKEDLTKLAKFLAHSASIVNTTAFAAMGAEFNDLGLCGDTEKYSDAFWECYAVAMSATMWHYSGTAAVGRVLTSQFAVQGASNLRVVDASVLPYVPGGNINAAVLAVAEKAADSILAARGTCSAA